MSSYENKLTNGLLKLLNDCDDSFLNDRKQKINFSDFIFMQYLRTKKMKDLLLSRMYNEDNKLYDFVPERFWIPFIFVATNMVSFTISKKKNVHIKFVKNTNSDFLTSDQPVVNIANNPDVDFAKLYYPISPSLGIVFPVDKKEIVVDDRELINELNNKIINDRDKYVFKI